MIRFTSYSTACLVAFACTFAQAAAPTHATSSPVGLWESVDEDGTVTAVVQIWEHRGRLYGKIVEVSLEPGEDPNPRCVRCAPPLRNHPIVGLKIIDGLVANDGIWDSGTILDPKSGSTYSCELSLRRGGRELAVRGYIGISLLGRTQTWRRAPVSHQAPDQRKAQP